MHHYANLQSKEDCEDMAFLSANSTPEYKESSPVYTFKEIRGAKGVFKPLDQIGVVSLRHFCFEMIGKRKRAEKPEDSSDSSTETSEGSLKKHQG